ncbi:hypothetical protein LY76DRAFT_166162 [Colletotrichum caudatum]|nr:hypothetical protein LY76DRAFT_166162 [Colletotrichum caudatum]
MDARPEAGKATRRCSFPATDKPPHLRTLGTRPGARPRSVAWRSAPERREAGTNQRQKGREGDDDVTRGRGRLTHFFFFLLSLCLFPFPFQCTKQVQTEFAREEERFPAWCRQFIPSLYLRPRSIVPALLAWAGRYLLRGKVIDEYNRPKPP